MKKVNIIHLTYRRKHFCKLLYLILSKCKFQDFHITLNAVSFDMPECTELYNYALSLGLSATIFDAVSVEDNYMVKLRNSLSQPYEYTIKIDDDVFLGPDGWDYIFDNIHLLDNEENILLTPALSTGIPTCDDFIKYNFSEKERKEMFELFGKVHIPNMWGSNFSDVNALLRQNGYSSELYYKEIAKVKNHFKGMHPLRINYTCVEYLNNTIYKNIKKFTEKREFSFEELTKPYLCNSFFAIKSNIYRDIINDKSLYVDGFDEAPINIYRNRTGKKFLYIPNTFGIHISYNTLVEMGMHGPSFVNYENEVFKRLESEITKQL